MPNALPVYPTTAAPVKRGRGDRLLSDRRHRPEQALHRAVFEHICWRGRAGTFAFHPANGGARSGIEAAIMKGFGVVAGVPDLIIIHNGRVFGLELKAANGRLSPAQRDVHERLRAAGAEVAVAVGLDEALQQLADWQLLRGAQP